MAKTLFLILPHILYLITINVSFCTLTASSPPPYKALVSPITKDPTTSLYTIPIDNRRPSVVDLAGPLIWSLCAPDHPTVACGSKTCAAATEFRPPNCSSNTSRPPSDLYKPHCNCTAYPVNPVTGLCAPADLTLTTVTANATDGKNPKYSIAFSDFISSCSIKSLLQSLPASASGVVGLGRSELSLPQQLSAEAKYANKFALCLPGGGIGVAFFGSGPLYLLPPILSAISDNLQYTSLIKNPTNPGYYIDVEHIAIALKQVPLPPDALALDKRGNGGVALSTVKPYTALRSDIYEPFLKAYSAATTGIQRMPATEPFDLCFNSSGLASTRLGYGVPEIDVMLKGGKNWTVSGARFDAAGRARRTRLWRSSNGGARRGGAW
ncbi:basic 7S globulin 2-like [Ananas comosus]|uniref:Basic 7S globulin 2-like n=1 Tax=Ananas comosus TaxID=4615 RepID=A0A6P5EFV8_ANACO|nr:basic 7S globulin 2-like [Ananas comosus]